MKNKSNKIQRVESILRLVQNTVFAIEPQYGITQLNKILFDSGFMSDATKDVFTELRDQSKQVDYYQDSKYVGTDISPEQNSVAVISISGPMTMNDGWCNVGMNTYDGILRKLYSNDNIGGVIIKFDSGGGYVDAGTIMYNAVKDKNKPVVVLTNFLGSAAVMGTLASDEIIAQTPLAEIGSVGVFTTLSKSALKYYKEYFIDVYSKHSPNKNKDIRDAIDGDFTTLTESVTKMDVEFMKLVKSHRPITGKTTLLGGMFQAQDAKKRGLIDSIGSLNYALKRINSLIKNK